MPPTFATHYIDKNLEIEEMLNYPEVSSASNYLSNKSDDDFGMDSFDFEYFPNLSEYRTQTWLMSLVDNSILEYNAIIESEVIFVFRLYISKILSSYFQLLNSETKNHKQEEQSYA